MTKEQAINTAVNWWANKLKARTPHSNGDSGRASIFACFLADTGMKHVTDEQLDIFKKELRKRIEDKVGKVEVWLGCDYNPTTDLRESAEAAGISEFNFPYKTDLYIRQSSKDEYTVRIYDGYAAPSVELHPIG